MLPVLCLWLFVWLPPPALPPLLAPSPHQRCRSPPLLRARKVKELATQGPLKGKAAHEYFDRVDVTVRAGAGGHGAVIRLPRGGKGPKLDRNADGDLELPPGGGTGGDVVLFVDPAVPDLLHLHSRPRLTAERGSDSPGLTHLSASARLQRNLELERKDEGEREGAPLADGHSLRVPVPPGTFVRTAGGKVLGDLVSAGQELVVATGGVGGPCVLSESAQSGAGRGRQRAAQGPGLDEIASTDAELFELTRGQVAPPAVQLQLLLRTVADVGFVGFPNAGKSTLLAALTRASPEVAPYPFTTLMPNLGVMTDADRRAANADETPPAHASAAGSSPPAEQPRAATAPVLADLPGLVEGAHRGKGLGRRFLQQLRRVRLVLFVVDSACASPAPIEQYLILRRELALYNPQYLTRPHLIALNKLDVLVQREGPDVLKGACQELKRDLLAAAREEGDFAPPLGVIPISGLHNKGLPLLKDAINRALVAEAPPSDA